MQFKVKNVNTIVSSNNNGINCAGHIDKRDKISNSDRDEQKENDFNLSYLIDFMKMYFNLFALPTIYVTRIYDKLKEKEK